MTVKKPSGRKSLRLFINIFMFKRELIYLVLDLQNQDANPLNTDMACGNIKKRKGHSKINEQVQRKLYIWITRHPRVVQSPLSNDCLKVIFYDKIEPQMVPKILLHVYVRELHNIIVGDPNDVSIKESRDEENIIIISDSTLLTLLPP